VGFLRSPERRPNKYRRFNDDRAGDDAVVTERQPYASGAIAESRTVKIAQS
jgi:hypothetical protein